MKKLIMFLTVGACVSTVLHSMNSDDVTNKITNKIKNNEFELAKQQIASGAQCSINSILRTACSFNTNPNKQEEHVNFIKYVIENNQTGVEVATLKNKTLLMFACESDNLSVITYLIGKGAKIDNIDKDSNSAIVSACKNGNLQIIEFLLEKNAVIDKGNIEIINKAISSNTQEKRMDIVKLLVAKRLVFPNKDLASLTLVEDTNTSTNELAKK